MKPTRLAWVFCVAAACSGSGGGVTSSEVSLASYDTCQALESDLKDVLIKEIEATFDQMRHGGWAYPAEDAPPGTPMTGNPRQEGVDYSGTNNQENGVDEADFVKTDGYFIYNLNGNRLHIFGVPSFGDLDPLSVTTVEGYPRDMLVGGDRVAVFSSVPVMNLPDDHPLKMRLGHRDPNGVWFFRTWDVTKITILDVSDRTHPTLVREIFLEGWYQAARKVDTSVRAGIYTWMNIPGIYYWAWYDGTTTIDEREAAAKAAVAALSLEDIVPVVYERLPDRTFNVWSLTHDGCRSFYRPSNSQGRGISTLLTFDLAASDFRFESDQILTNYATFYASQDYLYLAESAFDWWWFWWNDRDVDQTNIHMFDIRNPQHTFYVASGRVSGQVFDSFSLGEKDGFLRVATTSNWENRWWLPVEERPVTENNVYVLEPRGGHLRTVGALENLAPGERIFSSRFLGDQGFLVTFKQVDPLHTLDLSDPYHPRAVGELVTPGVATYLHPIEGGRLLTIGWGGDTTGLNWKTQIGLFDVSNFDMPRLQSSLDLALDGDWAYSEAQWEHKAFQYWAPKKLLAIPVASYRSIVAPDGYPSYSYLSTLNLVSVDPQAGLHAYGQIDHSQFFNSDANLYWQYIDIRRSIFMGDFIYAISDRGITVNRIADLAPVTSAALPGWQPDQYWWWW
jgi:hypothetical protein